MNMKKYYLAWLEFVNGNNSKYSIYISIIKRCESDLLNIYYLCTILLTGHYRTQLNEN